jgi:hypothetical protein
MGWLEFFASIIGSLTWPGVVLLVLWFNRKRLANLSDWVDELTFPGGAKIKFVKAIFVVSRDRDRPVCRQKVQGNVNQFPIYIVSKGRWKTRLTSRQLERLGVAYRIVVEEQEYKNYCSEIDAARILVLDRAYQRDYDTFDSLGETKSKGPGPARNFVWDHSIGLGAEWHWVMDDNIEGFYRLNHNLKVPVSDGAIFRCMEEFVLRYQNIGMAGPNYFGFASRKHKMPPFVANTRIYSCNLIRNDIGFRWRGRYNEDTDLSLRMLKAGWCTVQFNAFLHDKMRTQESAGGNTAEFYAQEGTLPKSRMQVA